MPLEEQTELFANRIRRLNQYHFLLRPAASEGTISTEVFPINILTVTHDPKTGALHFPDRELLGELRSILAAKAGTPVQQLLQEQDASLARYTQVVDGRMRRSLPTMQRATHTSGAAAPRTDRANPESAPAKPRHPALPAGTQIKRRVRIS